MRGLFRNTHQIPFARGYTFPARSSWFSTGVLTSIVCRRRIGAVILILAFLAAGVSRTHAAKMPSVKLEKLEGGYCRLPEDHAGAVVLIEFWGTCCRAKLSHLKYLDELFEQYKDRGLIVYGINVDDASAKSRIRPAAKRYGYEFPILLDPDRDVLRKFNPQRIVPHTLLISRDGEILFNAPGDKTVNRGQVEELLEKLFQQ